MLKSYSFGVETMRWMEIIETYIKEHSIEEARIVYEQHIINANSASLSIQFCNRFKNADVRKHQEIVLKSYDARHYYNFAKVANGANIKLLKESAFVLKDADVMVLFASRFPELGINEEQEFIISLNDPKYACLFAQSVPGCDVKRLEQIVIDSNDYKLAYSFAYGVKGADIEKLEDIVVASNDPQYIYYFALNVVGANKERLKQALLNIGNMSILLDFSTNVEYIEHEKLVTVACKNKDLAQKVKSKSDYNNYIDSCRARIVS